MSERVEAGNRELTFVVTYDGDDGRVLRSNPLRERVDIEKQSVVLANATGSLTVGERGTVNLTVRNDGPRLVRDATVTLATSGPTLTPLEPDRPLGTIGVDETGTATVPVRTASAADPGDRQVSFVVTYENEAGDTRRTDPLTARLSVADEQSFSLSAIESDLRVGEEGTISGTVTNDGPLPATDAVVVVSGLDRNVDLGAGEYALGDLAVGESATFSYPVETTGAVDAGPRQFSITVRYRDARGDQRASTTLPGTVRIGSSRDQFSVTTRNASVPAGGSQTVEVILRNQGDDRLTNLNAKAFVDDPLSLSSDEAFVPAVPSGGNVTIAFDVAASGSAPQRVRPLEFDVQYNEPDGDTRLTDTYQVAVDVTEGEASGGIGIVPIAVLIGVIVFVLVTWFVATRRGGTED
ncbi:hypothetical protein BRD17_00565 [Halobacteriales archaeon SW_7_68_16]|nr:MAG: hypothetical protein BRD17_00565 [Halobacteriales archaeon SW_7_68_16]